MNTYQPAANPQQYYNQYYMPQTPQPPQMMPDPKKKKKEYEKKKWIILGSFGFVGLILGIIAFIVMNKYVQQLTIFSLPGAPVIHETSASGVEKDGMKNEPPVSNSSAMDIYDSLDREKWDGKSRVTCLAMGLDYRDWVQNDGTPRSDTMMLLTYDPINKEAGMLSIPRDLWVAIPNHGYGRINTAYSIGEGEKLPGVDGKPGGGAGLAMRTVEMFLGVDIQYYAVVDFYGFIDFIDAIDKLAINVRDDITVDPLGEGNTVRLMAGVQDLDGATALAYARYRYTNGGDFERAQRQQDVIFAIYEQIKWQLPELLTTRFDAVFASIQRAIKTNLTFDELVKLAWTATDIEPGNIKRAVIAPPYQVEYGKTTDGSQDILVPIPDKIREARDSIFATEAGSAHLDDEYTSEQRIRDEAAKVTLYNGCSDPEKVNKTVLLLQQYGIQIVSIGSGTSGWNNSMTIVNGKPYTAKFLQETMAIPTGNITLQYDPNLGPDLTINLTNAWCDRLQ